MKLVLVLAMFITAPFTYAQDGDLKTRIACSMFLAEKPPAVQSEGRFALPPLEYLVDRKGFDLSERALFMETPQLNASRVGLPQEIPLIGQLQIDGYLKITTINPFTGKVVSSEADIRIKAPPGVMYNGAPIDSFNVVCDFEDEDR